MTMRDERSLGASAAAERLAHLERYWRMLVRHGLPPERGEIEPGRFGAALPGAFVIERIGPGAARMRVAGQDLYALLGGDGRGAPLSRLFVPAARPRLAALLDRGFEGQHACHAPLCAPDAGLTDTVGGLVLLPLRARPGAAPQMIGALMHDLGSGPNWRFGFRGPVRIGAPPAPAPRLRLVVSNDT